jgi:outer membrane protein assembly factor BamB
MTRKGNSWPVLLLLCAGLSLRPPDLQQTVPDMLVGTWSGHVHYSGESKLAALRFEFDDKRRVIVAFFSVPDLKLQDVGPITVEPQGDAYKAYQVTFHLALDRKSLTGRWSFDGHDLPFEMTPSAPLVKRAPTPPVGPVAQPVWTFKTGGAVWSSPAVVGNTVYFGSDDGIVYAVSADLGYPRWQFQTGGRVRGRPTPDGAYLYALSDDGYLYELDRQSGKSVWRFDTHGGSVLRDGPGSGTAVYDDFTSAATVSDGTVYVGSADKRLYALDAKTGLEKWHFDTEGMVRSTPAVVDGRVFFGSRDHRVYAVDARTGALEWRYDTLREVVSSPLVADGTVYIGSRASDLLALSAVTGQLRWKYFYWSSWVESSARIRNGTVYVGSSDAQQVFAIDAATGQRVWSADVDGSPWSTPAVTDDRVYIGVAGVLGYFIDHHGAFFALDRATGHVVWRYPMHPVLGATTYGVASSPAVGQGLVFFGGLDGTFYAFRVR